jgi:hypothetical protein
MLNHQNRDPSAPYTEAQNDGAERSGGVSKGDILTIAIGGKLPNELCS